MIKAVLFDLDGTLVDSIADLAASTNAALSEWGFPTHDLEKYKYFVGDGMAKLIERAMPEDKSSSDFYNKVFESFMNHYREHFTDNTKLYDGIESLIKGIKDLDIKMAVVSNKSQEMSERVVKTLLDDSFQIICGKRDGYPAKPDPTLTLKVMEELGVEPCECVFVGDSGMDMAVAVNAKCHSIGVLWGFRTKDELLDNGGEFIAEIPAHIVEIIKELNK